MYKQFPRNVLIGISIAILWNIIVVILWAAIGMYKSNYYSFGPSDNLYLAFLNIPINTWGKYITILFYICVDCVMKVIGGDFVYPYINAVVMNPEVRIEQNSLYAYILTNFYWMINSFNTVFFFALTMSQVDFSIATIISSVGAGMVSSYFVIFDEKRGTVRELYEQL